MKFIGAQNLEDLLRRVMAVEGVAGASFTDTQNDSGEIDLELRAQVDSKQSFTTGLGWANDRSLSNPVVEIDALKVLEDDGYESTISRPIEVRNDGTFALKGKKKHSPGAG